MLEQAINPLGVLPINPFPDNSAVAMDTSDLPMLDIGQTGDPNNPPGPKITQ